MFGRTEKVLAFLIGLLILSMVFLWFHANGKVPLTKESGIRAKLLPDRLWSRLEINKMRISLEKLCLNNEGVTIRWFRGKSGKVRVEISSADFRVTSKEVLNSNWAFQMALVEYQRMKMGLALIDQGYDAMDQLFSRLDISKFLAYDLGGKYFVVIQYDPCKGLEGIIFEKDFNSDGEMYSWHTRKFLAPDETRNFKTFLAAINEFRS